MGPRPGFLVKTPSADSSLTLNSSSPTSLQCRLQCQNEVLAQNLHLAQASLLWSSWEDKDKSAWEPCCPLPASDVAQPGVSAFSWLAALGTAAKADGASGSLTEKQLCFLWVKYPHRFLVDPINLVNSNFGTLGSQLEKEKQKSEIFKHFKKNPLKTLYQ